eukprot:2171099-Prymnesium_polylepis.1
MVLPVGSLASCALFTHEPAASAMLHAGSPSLDASMPLADQLRLDQVRSARQFLHPTSQSRRFAQPLRPDATPPPFDHGHGLERTRPTMRQTAAACSTGLIPLYDPTHAAPPAAPSVCCDWMDLKSRVAPPAEPPAQPSTFRALVFAAVSTRVLTKVEYLSRKLQLLDADLFLAHYDGGQAAYQERAWYRERVRFNVSYRESVKSRYLARELFAADERGESLRRDYSHVWLVDEDIAFPSTAYLRYFFSTAVSAGALIAQPAITGVQRPILRPGPPCGVRQTDFIEVMAPLLQTRVALQVCGGGGAQNGCRVRRGVGTPTRGTGGGWARGRNVGSGRSRFG